MIRNASMLRARTFVWLDALEAYQRPIEPEPRFKELDMPRGELWFHEQKRRWQELPEPVKEDDLQRSLRRADEDRARTRLLKVAIGCLVLFGIGLWRLLVRFRVL